MPIGSVIVDFACRSARIVVELDGGQHALHATGDDARTRRLAEHGWVVMRFWNNDVIENTEAVALTILTAVARASTRPQPLPFREGS